MPVVPPTFYAAGINYPEHVIWAAQKVGTQPNLPKKADVGYRQLLEEGGLELRHQEDASVEILKLLEDLESKLGMVKAWRNRLGSGIPELGMPEMEALQSAPELLRQLKLLVQDGKLGYWLFVARNQP